MNILMLGGTGAMGVYLQDILNDGVNRITITSRRSRENRGNIRFVEGDGHDPVFLRSLLSEHYDAIIDFMVYSTDAFRERYELLLSNTNQYVFLSSSRVYAGASVPMTESSPRLLDVCTDETYLKTDEYALAKARCEDLLFKSDKLNWTIIRPYITFSPQRLQLGVFEKENWLYRVLHGRTLVFSEDIASKLTTMTLGFDVAHGIAALLGKDEAMGQAFHITNSQSYSWHQILDTYKTVLVRHGYVAKLKLVDKCQRLGLSKGSDYQIIYCRYYDRMFDDSKISAFIDVAQFTDTLSGIDKCLTKFLEHPSFGQIDWRLEAVSDRIARERTPLSEIPSKSGKFTYICYRYHLKTIHSAVSRIAHLLHH